MTQHNDGRAPIRKLFSHGPYTKCPQCLRLTFGLPVLTMTEESYTKECYECQYSESYPLPKIKKKLIYLDQFVIDNFVKTLDPTHPKHEKVKQNPFWLEAYKKLDVLSKAQLIVCPDSFYHREESGPTGYFESMQRIYEHFSSGVTFYDENEITKLQMVEHFRNFLRGKPSNPPTINPNQIVHGDLHRWQDKIRISVEMKPNKQDIEERIRQKEKSYQNFLSVFKRWQTEKGKKFEQWYKEENRGFAEGTVKAISLHFKRREGYVNGTTEIDLFDLLPTPSVELVMALRQVALGENTNTEDEALISAIKYLYSPHIQVVPTINIGSALYAAIADQAAKGRKEEPSPGVFVDVQMISGFLPYCDAMFIDNESAALLRDNRVKLKIGYDTKIFCLKNKEEFLHHLEGILDNADPEHIGLIKRIYGDDWISPYDTILKHK